MSQQKRDNSDKRSPNKPSSNKRKPFSKSRTKSSRANQSKQTNYASQANLLKDAQELTFTINNLLHDGRGVGVYTPDNLDNGEHPENKHGKKIFVSFALPNETVKVKVTKAKKSFEEGDCVEVITNPNPQRQKPVCQHFGKCGGCSLQHWQADGQIAFKESVLAEHLEHQAGIVGEEQPHWLPPIIGDSLGYRTKARIGVRHLAKLNKTILGFRERSSNNLTDISECPIMDSRVGSQLGEIKALIHSLDSPDVISHLEVAMGEQIATSEQIGEEIDTDCQSVAILVRHIKQISHNDRRKLGEFFHQRNWQLYLQGDKNPKSIKYVKNPLISDKPSPDKSIQSTERLYYQLPEFDLTYEFHPTDFTQVNLSVNRQMVSLACELLDLKQSERVLDLFSGLGNFSLAMAKKVEGESGNSGLVIGVEGSNTMTQRAKDNAKRNGLTNTQFYTHDLTQDLSKTDWANEQSLQASGGFDALLIDPPRSGAWEVMAYLPKFNAKRIVYVSCNPATLARDSKALIEAGYRMTHAGVMDMFCHTGHVESIVRFEKV